MFPAQFEYHRPASVRDAVAMLKQFGDDARILAGGHSLLPMMKLRLAQPAHLIDIGRIKELQAITENGGKITIGAASTHDQIANDALVCERVGLLAECAAAIGDVQVRNRGTIGGSLSHSDPAADYPAGVLALEADLKLESESGARTVRGEDFFVDLMTTAARPGEILTQVAITLPATNAGYAYCKHRHPASGFAMVGVAALITLDARGNCSGVRVGVTGLGAKAFRAKAVEASLQGKAPDAATLATAASHAVDGIDPLSDIHASGEFRAELAQVYTRRALATAAARAKK
ncbi:MAG TPA: xanthine dehydrogenase family protein subunit M [Candidatus Binataceae bacterium]|nr:xanthine dehydrogenase family protein subunit M [Candidatus Binataceae bacterium]